MTESPLARGTLWPAILRVTEHALRCGALHPIETIRTTIEDSGVHFLIRQVSSLARKQEDQQRHKAQPAGGHKVNPFLPYDPALFVADLSETHLALLNKFNVIDHHLLIVTRRFEPQEALLNPGDFDALFNCMAEFDGLGFYNGGAAAGASQAHKHLQIVPLPLGESGPPLPIEPLIAAASTEGTVGAVGTVPGLPFLHALARLEPLIAPRPLEMARHAFDLYRALLDATGLQAIDIDGEPHQSAAYNLLVTTRWMLLVPRRAECVDGIAVNALGFAGSLFVRDGAQLEAVRSLGPMNVLQRAAG